MKSVKITILEYARLRAIENSYKKFVELSENLQKARLEDVKRFEANCAALQEQVDAQKNLILALKDLNAALRKQIEKTQAERDELHEILKDVVRNEL